MKHQQRRLNQEIQWVFVRGMSDAYERTVAIRERQGFVKVHNHSNKPLRRLKHALTQITLAKV